MTAYAMWQLSCDFEGETCVESLDDATASSIREARKNGRDEGWTCKHVNGRLIDLCPKHSQKTPPAISNVINFPKKSSQETWDEECDRQDKMVVGIL